ncbi:cytochrome C oxidase subunit II [Paenibacillus sp. sgz500958]|uniref:cytochrome C oxidase subunit II n=1 Tax=Paenibacillus sp. sgz500958 TaxID=3242475 RepID=UPI0036D38D4C
MKKIFAILFCTVFVLILSACGGNAGSNGNAGTNAGITDPEITPEAELVIKATNYSFDQQEYHLKKGVPVKIVFENESGNHGVLIPEFKLQLTRKDNSQVIVPEEAGTYEMTCAIMCGSGHSSMVAKIIVE